MSETKNILFSGVGGQGILLASEVTADALIEAGYDVKKSEVHGMAQRGGAVEAHLRYGERVYSPLIEPGSAHVQVSFELLEALRYLPYLNKDSKVIVNTQKIFPLSVATGIMSYPEGILDKLKDLGVSVYPVDAFQLAKELGEVRVVNMILVGMLSRFLPVKQEIFFDIIKDRVKRQFQDVNMEAFKRGQELVNL
ncbi:MAG: indolepyruvate oxidoreductase subunit beta [Nitrospirae bacterium]|nr:indolepyruvate oxidoreductase subunit beta [Nitrospirota bacterium]